VNLGSRLEGLTKVYGVKIVLSEYTRARLTRDFPIRELDEVRVKGKSVPLRIYELMTPQFGPDTRLVPELVGEFEAGRREYLARNWGSAKQHFQRCLEIHPKDLPSKLYLARLQQFAIQPPAQNWDGVAISMRG
jgi:adenylate cyclase